MSFAGTILNDINATVAGYTQQVYGAIVAAHSTEIHLVLVAYVALFGWAVMTQKIDLSLGAAVRHILTMVIVVTLATRWDWFSLFIYDVLTDGPSKLMRALSGGAGGTSEALDNIFLRGVNVAKTLWKEAGLDSWLPAFLGASAYLTTFLVVAYALFLIVLAKVALAVTLALAPLFILPVLFNATREFFTSYLRQIMNFALVPVLVTAFLGLFTRVIERSFAQIAAVPPAGALYEVSFLVLVEAILFVLLMQVQGLASGIMGGLQLSSMGAMGSAYQRLWGGKDAQARRQKLGEKLGRGARAVKDYADRKMGRGKSMVGRR